MNVRLQYAMPFTAGVHYKGRLIMNNYVLKVFMVTNVVESELTDTAFERLKYFINEIIDSTIFINVEEQEQCQLYADAGIQITTLPNAPVDQIVGVMLFHKLNAIMENRISIVETELSSHLGDNVVYIHSENEITQNIEIPAWWTSPDLTHNDLEIEHDSTIFAIQDAIGPSWRDLNLAWSDEVPTETGNIVFADFGKDDTKH